MEEKKKTLIWMALAGIIVLIAMVGYPAVKQKVSEYRQNEVSLANEQTIGSVEEVEANGGQTEKNKFVQKNTAEVSEESHKVSENMEFMVTLAIADEEKNVEVALFESESGICYFFMPGYAQNKQFVLTDAGKGSISIGSQRLYEGDSLKDVAWEEAYELTVFDKSEAVLMTAPVIFMCSSELPVLKVTTETGTMDDIHENKENSETGQIEMFDEKGVMTYSGFAKSINGRGNSTWGLAKKPYQFRLVDNVNLLGTGKSDTYNLIANGYDETKLRNQITFGMAKELDMAYVPEGKMVDLYVNNQYYGNYVVYEKLAQAKEIKEGYLIEREIPDRFAQEESGFVTTQGDCYSIQDPKPATSAQIDYIATLVQEFHDAVERKDGINPETGKHYSEYIDVESFAQKYLVEEVSRNYDGGVTSSFFYKPQNEDSDKIYAGPVWDYDVVFGNCNLDEIVSNPLGITKLNNHVWGTSLFADLYEQEDFYEEVVILYKEKVLPYLDYLLDEGIDQMVAKTAQSVKMDNIRWENLENRYQYYEDYDNNVRYLKYYIEKRRDFLSDVWLNDAVYHNVTFVVDEEAWQISCVGDGELPGDEPIPSRYSSLFMGWVTEDGVPFDKYKPIYEDKVFYSVWQELPVEDVVLN